jgi:hypothetical protein
MWPPNEENRKAYIAFRNEENLGRRAFLPLEAGGMSNPYIAFTDHNRGIYVPAGWFHLVYTLRGGYLGGRSFLSRELLDESCSALLDETQSLNANAKKNIVNMVGMMLLFIEKELTSADPHGVIAGCKAWLRLLTIFQTSEWGCKKVAKAVLVAWKKHGDLTGQELCVCGAVVGKGQLANHFFKEHAP